MKNKEEIDNSSFKNKISEQRKKYIITGVFVLSFLIVVLLGLIVEALINQHLFEFLQYTIFKQQKIILGSISLAIFYTSSLFMAIAGCFFILGAKWKQFLLISTIIGLILILISLGLSFISYDWQQEYSIARYLNSILLVLGAFGQLSVLVISNHNSYESIASKSKYLNKLLNFPFYILMFASIMINSILL